jgi:transcriptional regulator with XRE-family HTH domain
MSGGRQIDISRKHCIAPLTEPRQFALYANMRQTNSLGPAVVPYTALIGGVIQQQRKWLDLQQGHAAIQLGLSQSAYSRIESGDTAISVTQLRRIAALLQTTAPEILTRADQIAQQLAAQGAQITHEKKDNSAAILIGLGLLAAVLVATGSAST